MSGYRFYGSSLLIIYDGEKRPNKIDLRMIDFAKAVRPNESDFTYPPLNGSGSPDVGYLLGLKTLVQCFGSIYYQHTGINLDDESIVKTDVFFEIIDQYKKEV
jgi:hypothetical protein